MDTDYSKYFVDAQGDVTYVGQNSGSSRGKTIIPKEADMRFRNFVFPTAVSVGNLPITSGLTPTAVKPVAKITFVEPAGWLQTVEMLTKGP